MNDDDNNNNSNNNILQRPSVITQRFNSVLIHERFVSASNTDLILASNFYPTGSLILSAKNNYSKQNVYSAIIIVTLCSESSFGSLE